MIKRGFTIVELVVVMTIMAIFLGLGVISLTSSRGNARNARRAADIEVIAKGLETRYSRGNSYATAPFITQGSYPSVSEFQHAEGATVAAITPTSATAYLDKLLIGSTPNNFVPPDITGALAATFVPMCTTACAAENTTQINATVTANVYVYEPITSTNLVCIDTECVRYNLYYRLENGTIVKKSSKQQ